MATDPQGGRERLPIKVIMPKQGTERRVSGGGGPATPFRTVDVEYRQRLTNQVEAIERAVLPQATTSKSAPVRVKVIPKAAAKSHRPLRLFSEETCPIVGVGRIDELFVKGTVSGLAALKRRIAADSSDKIVKELSSIESIEPVTPAVDDHPILTRRDHSNLTHPQGYLTAAGSVDKSLSGLSV